MFLKLFLAPEAVAKGVANNLTPVPKQFITTCNCQRYSELQEPIIILLTCKKLLSTHLVNTYSSKTLAWNTSDTELFILGIFIYLLYQVPFLAVL